MQIAWQGVLVDIKWVKGDGFVDASGHSCQIMSSVEHAPWAGQRVSSQNLIGSELLISWSVCVRLACDLLQVVGLNTILDIGWVKAGKCVNSSGNLCQVVFSVEHTSWAGQRVSSQNLAASELLISRSVCSRLAPSLLQVVDISVLLDM